MPPGLRTEGHCIHVERQALGFQLKYLQSSDQWSFTEILLQMPHSTLFSSSVLNWGAFCIKSTCSPSTRVITDWVLPHFKVITQLN